MSRKVFDRFTSFLSDLERRGINYTLAHNRDESLMVIAAAPGERWEVEFLEDGSVEIERFISNGHIFSEETLKELFTRYSDEDSNDFGFAEDRNAAAMTYYIAKDNRAQWRWYLKAADNQIIATSGEGYDSKDDCLNAVKLVTKSSSAPIKEIRRPPRMSL